MSLDTKFEVLNKEEIKYCECSFVFNKNVTGHRISDIYITKATEDDFGFDDYVREPDDFIVLFLGTVRPYKHVETVIHAAEKLADKKNIKILIY